MSTRWPFGLKRVACGNKHTLIIDDHGQVWGFGRNEYGQLGLGHRKNFCSTPQQIPDISNAIGVACGASHTLIICQDLTLYSFGSNLYGQLGTGPAGMVIPTPQPLKFFDDVPLSIACGAHHSVVICSNSVYVFGANFFGQLGLGTNHSPATGRIPNIKIALGVYCGGFFTILRLEDGFYSFGRNSHGQLGLGHLDDVNVPKKMGISPSFVGCGVDYSIAVCSDGIYGVGNNSEGQLGLSHRNQVLVPTKIDFPDPVRGIACGFSHTLILTKNLEIFSCGSNRDKELGLIHQENSIPSFLKIPGVLGFSLGCGLSHSVIICKNSIVTFGNNSHGELGLGFNSQIQGPQKVLENIQVHYQTAWYDLLMATGSDSNCYHFRLPRDVWRLILIFTLRLQSCWIFWTS